MYNLRLGTAEDLPIVLELAEELFNSSVYKKFHTFDKNRITSLYLESLTKPQDEICTVLLTKNGEVEGFITMTAQPAAFSDAFLAVELGFYIREEERNYSSIKRLQEAYYYWAKRVGCVSLIQGKIKHDLNPETFRIRRI